MWRGAAVRGGCCHNPGVDEWSLWEGWDRAADIATALTIFGLGFLLAQLWNQRRDNRAEHERLEWERQEHSYRAITEQYTHLLELCLDRPHLTFPWMNVGRLDDRPVRELSEEQWLQDLLIYELLFETIEKAFILYRAHALYEDPSGRGGFVMRARPSDAELTGIDFRGRQWWGWDSWVDHFGQERLFWDRWEVVEDEDTYDGWFMEYMKAKREVLSPGAIDRGIR